MNIVRLASAVVWVDFLTVVLHRLLNLGNALDDWYAQFGMVAVLSDCLVIVLGIMLAQLLFAPKTITGLILTSVGIQMVHDVLFYLLVIVPVPAGHNAMIDLFKKYASENSWKILPYDALMIGSTVLFASYLKGPWVPFIGLLGLYGLSYIVYTR
jgi:uncharacterized protein YacL